MWTTRTTRLLAACDSFKGTLPSFKVGEAIEAGYHRYAQEVYPDGARPQFTHCPMSDGGAGLLDSLTYDASRHTTSTTCEAPSKALHLQRIAVPASVPITGPLGSPLPSETPATFACDAENGVIVVEMAEASGLPRIKDPRQRNPLRTTSYGTGEVIRYALEYVRKVAPGSAKRGVRLYLGIGGSATNDGGLGALQALGLDVYVAASSASEERLGAPFCGADLARVTRVQITDAMKAVFLSPAALAGPVRVKEVYLICDVDNPLVGPRGATYTFGPQKCSPVSADGAEMEDTAVGEVRGEAQRRTLDSLEAGMTNAAVRTASSLWRQVGGRTRDSTITAASCEAALLHAPGGGGAGGMSGFFRFVLGATFLPGADAVAELLNLRIPVAGGGAAGGSPYTGLLYSSCDILATGEGSFDSQTVYSHKTVGRLLEMAVEANIFHQLQYQHSGTALAEDDTRLVKGVLVLCGRCGFPSPSVCQAEIEAALVSTLLPTLSTGKDSGSQHTALERAATLLCERTHGASAVAVIKGAMPRIHVLPLAPHRFSVKEAMTQPHRCVQETVYQFLKACDAEGEGKGDSFAPRTVKSTVPQLPSSL